MLYLGCIQVISRLCLGCIKVVSGLFLVFFSGLYLGCV